MKKCFFGAFVALVVAGAAMFNVSLNSQSGANLSAISLANIEVLANEVFQKTATCSPCSESCGGFNSNGPCCACCSTKSAVCDNSGCKCQ
jgi:hypothetical protein